MDSKFGVFFSFYSKFKGKKYKIMSIYKINLRRYLYNFILFEFVF